MVKWKSEWKLDRVKPGKMVAWKSTLRTKSVKTCPPTIYTEEVWAPTTPIKPRNLLKHIGSFNSMNEILFSRKFKSFS